MAFVSRQLSALGWLFRRLGVAISGAESDVATAPTITAGTAAPSSTDEPAGSLYIRVSSTVGIYQYRSSAWVLVVGMGADFGATGLKADVVAESTAAAGVTIDGVVLKDGGLTVAPGASTAAAGTTTSDAGVLPAATSSVYPTTAADGTKGVRVHANDKVTGRMLLIGNGVSNQILKVYPPAGGAINGAAADAAFSSDSGKGVVMICLSSGSNTWLAW